MVESDVFTWVRGLMANHPFPAAGPVAIAIDGRSGAGKSQLAEALATELGSEFSCFLVHLDDLYPGWNGLDEGSRRVAAEVLEPWRTTGSAQFRAYDWATDGPGSLIHVPHVELLIIEGCGSGASWNRPMLDAVVWIEAGDALRHARAAARDGDVEPWWEQWSEQEQAHYATERTPAAAAFVIDAR